MSAIKGNQSDILDSIARNILAENDVEKKFILISSYKNIIEFRSREEIRKEKEDSYRRWFTLLVVSVYIVTNFLIGYIIISAYEADTIEYVKDKENYQRIVDGKVIIALITGVVVQTATSFGILTRYVYGHGEVTKEKAK